MPLHALPPPPPPLVSQPAAFEVSYGLVTGTAPRGTVRLIVRADGRIVADEPMRSPRFRLRVALPQHDVSLRVTAIRSDGERSSRRIGPVYGLPDASRPRFRTGRLDPLLQREIERLARSFGPTAGVYVQSLTKGGGAAWNARASFPAASTLKLAIAATALSRVDGVPPAGSYLDGLLRRMITVSDDEAANSVLTVIGGSTSSGGHAVNELMRSIGMQESEMYGGYLVERSVSSAIPLRVESQPGWGVGKRTTPYDLSRLARAVWLASGNLGPLRKAFPGLTAADARYLMWLLAHVRDPGKLDRFVGDGPGIGVLHKAGWIDHARHDHGLVFWRGGVFVAAVMTYRSAGAGASSDVLAGRVAQAALTRFLG